jgi:glycosyltransferase involved in cell wall biosynthesis
MSLRVCIDARINPGISGGLEQSILGLASGLVGLTDGDEEYLFLVEEEQREWLIPYLRGCAELLVIPSSRRRLRAPLKSLARPVWHAATPLIGRRTVQIPASPGLPEASGVRVMHFTTQRAFVTRLPFIYQPWDLQYLHFPEFFTARQRLVRETWDREFCGQAATVVVASEFGRRELVERIGVAPENIAVVPVGPGTRAYTEPSDSELEQTRKKFALPSAFSFYPAQTWPHKNHLRLLEALALLRDRGLPIPLVCSGHTNSFYKRIEARVRRLQLTDLVSFVGFVEPVELRSLYALARAFVYPTLFEGGGMPTLEAFDAGVPVACSNVTCLPEQVGGAALTFDPYDVEAIAAALGRVWVDESLRDVLVERGRSQLVSHDWNLIARMFRAHYRRLAGSQLSDPDLRLLKSDTPSSGRVSAIRPSLARGVLSAPHQSNQATRQEART